MEAVSIVIIKSKIPLYRGEEQANAIELIKLEEVGYELVANKTLYQICKNCKYFLITNPNIRKVYYCADNNKHLTTRTLACKKFKLN